MNPFIILDGGPKWIAGVRFFAVYRVFEDDIVLRQISDEELNDPGYRA
jgi:hypothetical protein